MKFKFSTVILICLMIICLPTSGCRVHTDPVFNIGNNFSETVNVFFNDQKVGNIPPGSNKKLYPNDVLSKTDQFLQVDLKTNSGTILFSKRYTWDELTKILENVHGNPYWIGPGSQ